MPYDTEQAPPHAFPSWPLNCLTFYRHLADDYGRCVRALGEATDPAQAARAEGDYGVGVMHDFMQAWWDLALTPMTAMIKAGSGPFVSSAPETPSTDADEAVTACAPDGQLNSVAP
jgi:hypothetical protein